MEKIKLTPRLQRVADLVRNSVTVADIGTDHGYLATYLVQNGKVTSAIASDLREGPLEMAKATVAQCGFEDKIQLRLSDGLQSISGHETDDIVIAGMGGELIAEILSNCTWIKDNTKHLVLQPMTHSDVLREYLCNNHFEIISDVVVRENKKLYNVIEATYSGVRREYPSIYKHIGKISNFDNLDNCKFLEKTILHLKKKLLGVHSQELVSEIEELEKLL